MGNTQARKYLTCVSSDSELDCFVGLPFLLAASFEGAAPVLWNPTGCHNYSQVLVSTYTSDLSRVWKRWIQQAGHLRTHLHTGEKSNKYDQSDFTSSLESHWVRQLFSTAQHVHIRLEQSLDKLRDDTGRQNHHLIMPISCKTSQYCLHCAKKFCPKNFCTKYWIIFHLLWRGSQTVLAKQKAASSS